MKISIITVVRNGAATIEQTIQSVQQQSYKNIEHILIDGDSDDHTMEIVNRHKAHFAKIISEQDAGLYDAMNKGISHATGDVIGILNSDDIYQDETILAQVAKVHSDLELDACYADLVYVQANDLSKVVRNWQSCDYTPGLCFNGWMPAHPTLFLKKHVYQQVGKFDTKLKFQADLEFCARMFEVHKINSQYVAKLWVRMRTGGVTNNSLKNIVLGNWESYQALKQHGLKANPFKYFSIKFVNRIKQYF